MCLALLDPNRSDLYAGRTGNEAEQLAHSDPRPESKGRTLMFLAVFVGGALGSLLREVFSLEIPGAPFLTTTFGINLFACFVLGWLYAVRHRVHAHVLHLGGVGFCGGLSTFSSFVAELERLAQSQIWVALSAAGLEIALGLSAAVLGEALGRRFHANRQTE